MADQDHQHQPISTAAILTLCECREKLIRQGDQWMPFVPGPNEVVEKVLIREGTLPDIEAFNDELRGGSHGE